MFSFLDRFQVMMNEEDERRSQVESSSQDQLNSLHASASLLILSREFEGEEKALRLWKRSPLLRRLRGWMLPSLFFSREVFFVSGMRCEDGDELAISGLAEAGGVQVLQVLPLQLTISHSHTWLCSWKREREFSCLPWCLINFVLPQDYGCFLWVKGVVKTPKKYDRRWMFRFFFRTILRFLSLISFSGNKKKKKKKLHAIQKDTDDGIKKSRGPHESWGFFEVLFSRLRLWQRTEGTATTSTKFFLFQS